MCGRIKTDKCTAKLSKGCVMKDGCILLLQVDEIMLTLKQAFSVAALLQNAKTQSQQCDSCPMQQFHKLCERIEGRKLSRHSTFQTMRKIKSKFN